MLESLKLYDDYQMMSFKFTVLKEVENEFMVVSGICLRGLRRTMISLSQVFIPADILHL
jgi:hypothetical protein